MNDAWRNFLLERGAYLDAGTAGHFGNAAAELRAARDGGIISPMLHLSLMLCNGDDAKAFLQGQLSNDINRVSMRQSQYTSYCSPKGRMLANFLLWQETEGYCLQLAQDLQPAIQKRLGMFVLRSKVKLADASAERAILGLSGIAAAEALQEFFVELPRKAHDIAHDPAHGTLIALPGGRFQIVADTETAKRLWSKLAAKLTPVGTPCWEWLEISNGLPLITTATQEQFVPQMANMELIGGVDFKKGCYPGQEIVARTQYRGQLKRRMVLAHMVSESAPQPGDELCASNLDGQAAGMVVNAQAAPEGGYDLLAVVQTDSAANASLHFKSSGGPRLQVRTLPYAS